MRSELIDDRHLAVLGQGDQLLHRFDGELAQPCVGRPRDEARRRERQLQQHAARMGDEDVTARPAGRARSAHRHHGEPPTEERVPGVGDLDLG